MSLKGIRKTDGTAEYIYTDDTLSEENAPGEAKAAGDRIAGVEGRVTTLETAAPEIISNATKDWLDGNVTPTGSAVAIDRSLTQSGLAADAKAAGDAVNDLKSDLNYILISSQNLFNPSLTTDGSWVNNSTGEIYSDDPQYGISDYIAINEDANYGTYRVVHAWYYDTNKTYINHINTSASGVVITTPTNAKYMIIGYALAQKNNVTVIKGDSIPEATPYKEPYLNPALLEEINDSMDSIESVVFNKINLNDIDYVYGELAANGALSTLKRGIRFDRPIYLQAGSTVSVNGYRYNIAKFTYDESADRYTFVDGTYVAPTLGTIYTVQTDGYYMVSIWKSDNTSFNDMTATASVVIILDTNLLERMEDVERDIQELQNPTPSVYNKSNSTYWGEVSSEYYGGQQSDYTADSFGRNTLSSAVIEKFDELVDGYYVKKIDLGICSDETNHLYEYDFVPPESYMTDKAKTQPLILITSGQHGFEKASVYGLFYFLKDLIENWDKNITLEYMRHHVRFKVIPVCNPYGFDNNKYWNANGVNINRNYATSGWALKGEPFSTEYGGQSAGSEIETQIISSFVTDNPDAIALMDFHTNGQYSVKNYDKINWLDFPPISNDFYHKFKYWACSHVETITGHFNKEYNLGLTTELCGKVTSGENSYTKDWPSLDVYALEHSIAGHTIEGFTGFPSRSAFSAEALKGNAELIGNWIGSVIYGCHLL